MMNALLSAAQNQTTWTVLKATLLFTIALFLLRSARRVPASLRHRVAATTFAVALLLPLGAAWTPRDITLPTPVRTARTTEPARTSAAEAAPSAETTAVPVRRFPVDLRTAAWLVYLSGLAYFLISLGSGIVRLYRLRAGAEVSVEGMRLAREIAGRDGIRRGVEVVISPRLASL